MVSIISFFCHLFPHAFNLQKDGFTQQKAIINCTLKLNIRLKKSFATELGFFKSSVD